MSIDMLLISRPPTHPPPPTSTLSKNESQARGLTTPRDQSSSIRKWHGQSACAFAAASLRVWEELPYPLRSQDAVAVAAAAVVGPLSPFPLSLASSYCR